MDRRREMYTATGVTALGVLGGAIANVLLSVTTVPTHAPLAFWGLFAISLALFVSGVVWMLVIRARLRRDIAGR
jgi:hypothetical protein